MESNWQIGKLVLDIRGNVDKKLHLVGDVLLGISRSLTPIGKGAGSSRLKGATDYTVKDGNLRIGNNVEYAIFVEKDTKPHIIRPKKAKALYWKGAGHPRKIVHHPGTKAQPFLEPLITDYNDQIMGILTS